MAEMEAVNAFNAELQSLYDVKPPISKGKMTSVTKAALKAVKLYKHVVQSVEKFIQKCKPEYKIPGLYVIDSIIRQSRHQFGSEKDVFAPRFARSIQNTFVHLYKCPEEEKPKIIRVLNLWQKNKIFSPDVIQPLFDLADPNNPIWEQLQCQEQQQPPKPSTGSGNSVAAGPAAAAISSLLNNLPSVPFRKEVLDYDYGDEEEGDAKQGGSGEQSGQGVGFDALGSILSNPEILRQLATLQEQIAAAATQPGGYPTPEQERQRKLEELKKQEAAFDARLAQTVKCLPFAVDCELPQLPAEDISRSKKATDQNSNQLQQHSQLLPPAFFQHLSDQQHQGLDAPQHAQQLLHLLGQRQEGQQNPFGLHMPFPGVQFQHQDLSQAMNMFNNQQPPNDGNQSFGTFGPNKGVVEIDLTDDAKERKDRRRKRSRDRRSRSRSRSRRSRSRSRGRDRKRYRSRSRERMRDDKNTDREKEKERVRKGLPAIKKDHLSVCSTTLWVGHLSKLVSQEELSDTFGAYGDIVSIDLIPPRGCAFIVMNRRQDAGRALDRLKNTKLQGKTITVAWAPGKGMKGKEWKDYWEVDIGVSYIPWSKLRLDTKLEDFEDGGCVDEDTLPDSLKHKVNASDRGESENSQDMNTSASSTSGIPMPEGVPKPGETPGTDANTIMTTTASLGTTTPHGIPGMPNTAFGLPSSMSMMSMGMPVGMVPPPMMGHGGMPPFPGMGVPGMPGIPPLMPGILPPMGMGGPPGLGGPGLLGEMPNPAALANLSQLSNMSGHQSNLQGLMDQNNLQGKEDEVKTERRDGKRRSRFNDPDEVPQPMDESSRTSLNSQEEPRDERPLFERLKSMADYGNFANDKTGPSLLGAPGAMLGGPGVGRGFNKPNIVPPGPDGRESGVPQGNSWLDAPNPFLNPDPNPFAGNPFIQSSFSDNPFDIGAPPPAEPAMFGERSSSGGGPGPNRFGWGRGRGNNFNNDNEQWGSQNEWGEDKQGKWGRGRGTNNEAWKSGGDDNFGFGGRGRGRRFDSPRGDRGGRDDDRRGRRDRRDSSRDRDRDRGERGSRERHRSRENHRDNRRRSSREDRDRFSRRSREPQSEERVVQNNEKQEASEIVAAKDENWEEESWEDPSNACSHPQMNQDQGSITPKNENQSNSYEEEAWAPSESQENEGVVQPIVGDESGNSFQGQNDAEPESQSQEEHFQEQEASNASWEKREDFSEPGKNENNDTFDSEPRSQQFASEDCSNQDDPGWDDNHRENYRSANRSPNFNCDYDEDANQSLPSGENNAFANSSNFEQPGPEEHNHNSDNSANHHSSNGPGPYEEEFHERNGDHSASSYQNNCDMEEESVNVKLSYDENNRPADPTSDICQESLNAENETVSMVENVENGS